MGMLVNGIWQQQDLPLAAGDGSFVRPQSGFRDHPAQARQRGDRLIRGCNPGPAKRLERVSCCWFWFQFWRRRPFAWRQLRSRYRFDHG